MCVVSVCGECLLCIVCVLRARLGVCVMCCVVYVRLCAWCMMYNKVHRFCVRPDYCSWSMYMMRGS